MYLLVQAHEYKQHAGLLSQSFQLRKTVFFDRLGWDVSINGEVERDECDDLNPAYLLWCNETRDQLYGLSVSCRRPDLPCCMTCFVRPFLWHGI